MDFYLFQEILDQTIVWNIGNQYLQKIATNITSLNFVVGANSVVLNEMIATIDKYIVYTVGCSFRNLDRTNNIYRILKSWKRNIKIK